MTTASFFFRRATYLALACAMGVALSAVPGIAAVIDASPVLVEADHFGYDTKEAMVLAEGHAEVIQNEYIVLADRISYNQNTGIVKATGNVTVSEPSGNVYFAENVELKNEVKTGVIHNFKARLADNALFAAREARKVNDTLTELDYAVYSACKACEAGKSKNPTWQVKAKRIEYDEAEQQIRYHNAFFEMWGVPVFYTPYFSHAAPDADRKSGFLMPSYQLSGNLGAIVRAPYYMNIAPNKDAIVTPIYTSNEGPAIAGNFRHLLPSGLYELGGSVTRVDRINKDGAGIVGKEWRGHVEGNGEFGVTDFWDWGFNVKHASDDTYLRLYEFGSEDLLTSRVYMQGYEGRTMASVEAIGFQGLRKDDDASIIPYIHPLANVSHETDPGWKGSRIGLEGNVMALSRDLGAQSRRLSTTAYWRVPHITDNGNLFEMRTQMRSDLYSVDDQPVFTAGGPEEFQGLVGRVVPEVWLDWSYPMIRRFENSSLMIEPLATLVVGMGEVNSNRIPNEDSFALEFSDANLFSADPYPGLDLVESGTRVSYGIRGQWGLDAGSYVSFLFGQNYHTDSDSQFPYSSDLTQSYSDYVGRIAWDVNRALQLAYRFRLDQEDLELMRNEVESRLALDPLTLRLNYVQLTEDPYVASNEEVRGATSLALTDKWSWLTDARRDLSDDGGMIRAGTGIVFQNECLTLHTSVNRQYIRDRDIEPSTTYKVEVFMKNLN